MESILTISVSVRLFCTLHLHPKGMCYTSAVLELPYSDMDAWELQDPGHVPKCHTGRFEKLATEIFRDALPPPYVNSISVPSFCPSLLSPEAHATTWWGKSVVYMITRYGTAKPVLYIYSDQL